MTTPPSNFDEQIYDFTITGVKYAEPLFVDSNNVKISNASMTSDGIVNTSAQTFGGLKTFLSRPRCNAECVADNEFASKLYVDSLKMGLSWNKQVISFHDFSTGEPAKENGNRYISLSSYSNFDINNIYEWENDDAWVETVAVEGLAVYVSNDSSQFANECIVFNGTEWISIGLRDYNMLLNKPNQPLNTTDDVQFNSLKTNTVTLEFADAEELRNLDIMLDPEVANMETTANNLRLATGGTEAVINNNGIGIAANNIGTSFSVGSNISFTADNKQLNLNVINGSTDIITDNDTLILHTSGRTLTLNPAGVQTGTITIEDTTEALDASSGALVVAGGVGIAGDVIIGNSLHVDEITTKSGDEILLECGDTSLGLANNGTVNISSTAGLNITGNVVIDGSIGCMDCSVGGTLTAVNSSLTNAIIENCTISSLDVSQGNITSLSISASRMTHDVLDYDTSLGTHTLTEACEQIIYYTGNSAINVILPTLQLSSLGWTVSIRNKATANVTIKLPDTQTVHILQPTGYIDLIYENGWYNDPRGIPPNVIMMFNGNTPPSGWTLCNGTHSSPDLRDRFIIGYGSAHAVGASGGSFTISQANLPSHTHTISHTHSITIGSQALIGSGTTGAGNWSTPNTTSASSPAATTGAASTANSGSTGTGTDYKQPYYCLAFIMKL